MASYRPFPPPSQSTFAPPPPNQTPLPPPQPPPPRGTQYSQNWGYNTNQSFTQMHYQHGNYGAPPPQQPPPQHIRYPPPPPPVEAPYQPPPPPPQNSMNLPPQPAPPLPPMYYPSSSSSSQYNQFNHQPLQQPPPPPSPPSSSVPPPPPSSSVPPPPPSSSVPPPPPSSSIPPPPPPSSPPPPPANQSTENRPLGVKGESNDRMGGSGWRELGNPGVPSNKVHNSKTSIPRVPVKKPNNGSSGIIETEEDRRLRKKRELEKQKQDNRHRQQLKESQNKVLQKTQLLSSGMKGHGSITGSHMGERRTNTLLGGERNENRLKKPTTFLCKLKFRNELPEPTAQPKLFASKRDKDRFTKYSITSLEKMHKLQLYVEPDLGIPLDLLNLSIYNCPRGETLPLDPEDEVLLRDNDPVTPIKKDGLKRKERPTDKGVSWLVKTQYISPLSMEATKQSLTEKQAKELREKRGGCNILEDDHSRERKIKNIEASFEACKSRPVHASNGGLQPVEILPLLPDFDRYNDQFVVATFDSAPTADSENYSKLEKSVRDAHESQAIMKSFVATGSDSSKSDKFLAYMVPSIDEISKDMYDEDEDISFSWVREYHWDVRGDDADDPSTYLVAFGESEARYLPLPTKLILRKKRAKEGKSNEEVEHFPVPSWVTVRQRSIVSAVELKESGGYSSTKHSVLNSKRKIMDMDDGLSQSQKVVQDTDMDQSSGGEYDLSD